MYNIKRGKIYGNLTILGEGKRKLYRTYNLRTVDCICICGNKKNVLLSSLKNGYIKSCGCIRGKHNLTHGLYKTKIYKTYYNMLDRCNNINNKKYKNYGGRGIKVEWDSFEEFYKDMGDKPKGMTIEREDNEGYYNKHNCIWATQKEQNRNRRTTLKYKGENLYNYCINNNLNYKTITSRLYRGRLMEKAIINNL